MNAIQIDFLVWQMHLRLAYLDHSSSFSQLHYSFFLCLLYFFWVKILLINIEPTVAVRILDARAKPPKFVNTHFCRIKTTPLLLMMGRLTRSNPFRTPSPEPLAGKEATTRRKCKFFDALAQNGASRSLRSISREYKISEKHSWN